MSVKIEIKGFVDRISKPVKTKSGKYLQKIVMRQPAFTNQFGETVGKDNFFELLDFRENEGDFPERMRLLKSKVKATAYLNGIENVSNSEIFYNTMIRLKELEQINGKEA